MRNTRQRTLLTELVSTQQHAFTAEELWSAARDTGGPVGLATVYRTLALLEADGRVRRLDRGRFIACEPGHHHHLVCGACGKVEPFADQRLEQAIEAVEERSGYSVVAHEVVLRGACADCQP